MPFKPIDPKPEFPKLEEEVLKFWEDNQIFQKSLEQTSNGQRFVFFEGPPTANGKPGIHHLEARAFKDLIPRYQTMRGKFVLRKGGWDTHGLPVELEVEKKLGISGKKQIESIKPTVRDSIIEFNRLCKESVWAYKEDWENLTRRMGFWVDLENPYVTYDNSYIESVWWIIKQVWDKGLIYLGHKVVPYCPRCGTALSSHEVAQGYQNIVDQSVFVKFKLKNQPNTSILSWTTTPWTLPGNVALAVGENIEYVKAEKDGEVLILAKETVANVLDSTFQILDSLKGSELVGLEYEPLFDIPALKSDKSYKVYAADFVTTTDGTGVVHTAVMYGEDDYELGKKIGLPQHHTVDETGKFTSDVSEFAGLVVKDKTTEKKIFEYLKAKDFLYKVQPHKHDYPFCWRCGTPLLYYARDSWFIAMSKLRDQLKANNEQINWVPDYIKHGRFGEWLDGAKDWAISRERYWGTPLPIWQCVDCKSSMAVGSIKDLQLSSNTFYFTRHGQAENNVQEINSSWPETKQYHLTEDGKKQVEVEADKLKKSGGVDLIFSSDITRDKETAELISKELGVDVIFDPRIREVNVGDYNGKPYSEYNSAFPFDQRWDQAPTGGETNHEVQKRMEAFVTEINQKYQNKKILVVSHGDPLLLLMRHFGSNREYPQYADTFEMNVSIADLHRPYIDDVVLKCKKCGKDAKRVPAVMDVWLDSGSMPYAQWHYPFENKEKVDGHEQFPADYISEAIDQTRGWFYTLVAVSTLLDRGPAFKNVINLGHLLDSKGQKMSKSKGNVIDPWTVINKYGVDAVRWYMYSVNQPGDNKLFGEKDAELVLRKNFVILWNIFNYFVTYANETQWEPKGPGYKPDLTNPLDLWIVAKTQELTNEVTDNFETYNIFRATRLMENYIQELSTWYLRRSRGRKDNHFFGTLRHALMVLAKLMAPATPFLSEMIYGHLNKNPEVLSVHLAKWPDKRDLLPEQTEILLAMEQVRSLVEQGHALRKLSNVKLRQPLASVIYNAKTKLSQDLEAILADELNVKAVTFGEKLEFDLNISPELKKEGLARELERLVQELRKKTGLKVGEVVNLTYDTEDGELIAAFALFDTKKTYIGKISKGPAGETQEIDGKRVAIELKK
jgi:isoleucyl-tRNA synthetase